MLFLCVMRALSLGTLTWPLMITLLYCLEEYIFFKYYFKIVSSQVTLRINTIKAHLFYFYFFTRKGSQITCNWIMVPVPCWYLVLVPNPICKSLWIKKNKKGCLYIDRALSYVACSMCLNLPFYVRFLLSSHLLF